MQLLVEVMLEGLNKHIRFQTYNLCLMFKDMAMPYKELNVHTQHWVMYL